MMKLPSQKTLIASNEGGTKDVEKILKVVSRSGVSTILFALDRYPMRFSQLMFETRLNPGILDRHLKSLMQFELVEKGDELYTLTPKGEKILNIINQIFGLQEVEPQKQKKP
ncbi:hypothetical protein Asulf_00842 [Archaeoglobus sulfaticallidus PM70-1]|uniref:ArnR1-like winged helix-turn-helix domain-containing protein n=1 Tax=Archaeoglobus sulfaticallidus PM70-1 TaxID=387631 RepID=N0BKW1_9EURY|nr:winged helix-turn-helix domain-containing protein [Archaeoglobus sulfaticallidus]AGK60850.1 hypothetical protein Asulf_00842 [Archaeoglobus sulfaticallidus PM70-1]